MSLHQDVGLCREVYEEESVQRVKNRKKAAAAAAAPTQPHERWVIISQPNDWCAPETVAHIRRNGHDPHSVILADERAIELL